MRGNEAVEKLVALLAQRYGDVECVANVRILTFGSAFSCSVNYSKLLSGHHYFFGLSTAMLAHDRVFPKTTFGEFVVLVCGSADNCLVLPRSLVLDAMRGVKSQRLDVFLQSGAYILQTTKHPKIDVTRFLNAFPEPTGRVRKQAKEGVAQPERVHVRIQAGLIKLGLAEGCAVWVPPNDRNMSHGDMSFANRTVNRLPNLGIADNTRRIVQNIDVLWLRKDTIVRAFEVEASTAIYSGLLRLNDLVLAQPNIQIRLYLAASRERRNHVQAQLWRPSFHSLLAKCEFISFEEIENKVRRIADLPIDSGARVSGLIKGEKFILPEQFVYPPDL